MGVGEKWRMMANKMTPFVKASLEFDGTKLLHSDNYIFIYFQLYQLPFAIVHYYKPLLNISFINWWFISWAHWDISSWVSQLITSILLSQVDLLASCVYTDSCYVAICSSSGWLTKRLLCWQVSFSLSLFKMCIV